MSMLGETPERMLENGQRRVGKVQDMDHETMDVGFWQTSWSCYKSS
jgi:hypothetical protein